MFCWAISKFGMPGPVAQWIERFRPKEEVVRSTRTRVTKFTLLALF